MSRTGKPKSEKQRQTAFRSSGIGSTEVGSCLEVNKKFFCLVVVRRQQLRKAIFSDRLDYLVFCKQGNVVRLKKMFQFSHSVIVKKIEACWFGCELNLVTSETNVHLSN